MADQNAVDPTSGNWLATILFFIYTSAYGGFMLLSGLWPRAMAMPVLFGVNLAIVYGLALILGAILVAFIYMLCGGKPADERNADARSAAAAARGKESAK